MILLKEYYHSESLFVIPLVATLLVPILSESLKLCEDLRVYLHDVWSACWPDAVEARNCISVAIAPENSKVLLPHPSGPILPGAHGTS